MVKDEEDGEMKQEIEEVNAANVFYEQLKDKADIGQIAGEAIVSFSDVLFLTPRGRYDIDIIDREEQESIENFCQSKGLRIKNEEKVAKAMLAKAINEADDDDDDGDVDMGSAGDDELEDDGDFQSGSDSDVAEEFDSDAPAESDSESGGDDRPPKKKSKN
ncbi:hypothetical protein QCA50_017856 [Cerrena zonata]|uniref:Uncharacterized protein n=1 Tax=Cerrena zonata TaxID=2478898 RepID=A0AAW0FID1_9APHY